MSTDESDLITAVAKLASARSSLRFRTEPPAQVWLSHDELSALLEQIPQRFESDRHALYTGWMAGIAVKNGLRVAPLMAGEDYTDRIGIVLSPDVTITVVVPYPPDDWEFTR